MLTEIPGRRAQTDWPDAGDLLEGVGRPVHQIALGLPRQNGIQFVDPPVNADFMSFGHDTALFVGVEKRGDGGDIEARLDSVLFQELQDSRHAYPITVLAPRQAADRFAAVAQITGLVVAVERERDGAPRVRGPFGGPQLTPGADTVDELAPVFLGPLPGFEVGLGSVHLFLRHIGIRPAEKTRRWSER